MNFGEGLCGWFFLTFWGKYLFNTFWLPSVNHNVVKDSTLPLYLPMSSGFDNTKYCHNLYNWRWPPAPWPLVPHVHQLCCLSAEVNAVEGEPSQGRQRLWRTWPCPPPLQCKGLASEAVGIGHPLNVQPWERKEPTLISDQMAEVLLCLNRAGIRCCVWSAEMW